MDRRYVVIYVDDSGVEIYRREYDSIGKIPTRFRKYFEDMKPLDVRVIDNSIVLVVV